jgi:hypothetical protein
VLQVGLPVVCVLDARVEQSLVELGVLFRSSHEQRIDLKCEPYKFTFVVLDDEVQGS